MVHCSMLNCSSDSRKTRTVHFFRFPKNETFRQQWIDKCCRTDPFNVDNARICSLHFVECDYARNLQSELLGYAKPRTIRQIKPEAVPSQNLPESSRAEENLQETRAGEEERRVLVENPAVVETNGGDSLRGKSHTTTAVEKSNLQEIGVNTDLDDRDEKIALLKRKIFQMKSKISQQETELQRVRKLFTPGQLKKLANPQDRPKWSVDDISTAFDIYTAGPESYRLLLEKGFPFPAIPTLRSWRKKVKLNPEDKIAGAGTSTKPLIASKIEFIEDESIVTKPELERESVTPNLKLIEDRSMAPTKSPNSVGRRKRKRKTNTIALQEKKQLIVKPTR